MSSFLKPWRALRGAVGRALRYWQLPAAARAERARDVRSGLPAADPGPERVIREGIAWLARAQDHSASRDGGVARHYSLINGWAPSYPETTGYIIPTLLNYANWQGGPEAEEARRRARRMLDWLVSIQLPNGAFQAGVIDPGPIVPVTFNTGQILKGLADGVRAFGEAYLGPMHRAATWLVESQDADGCWRNHPTPRAAPGEKAYETHVAWGLLRAARACGEQRYAEAGLKNVRWALTKQLPNGWFEECCLSDNTQPLTHTLGYVLRGVVEAYLYAEEPDLLAAARRTADGLLSALGPDGLLPGRLDRTWRGTVPWVCLTGSVQVAMSWLLLSQATGDARYREAAFAANRFVRRSIKVDGPPETRGGVKGAFPVHGAYGPYQYLNWACKFCIDANLLELAVRQGQTAAAVARPVA